MRMTLRAMAMVAVMMLGVGAAVAQDIDPTTGAPFDPSTDPAGYAMDQAMQASAQAQATFAQFQASVQATDDANEAQIEQNAMNPTFSSNQQDDNTPAAPAIPKVAKPVIAPKGGKFTGEVTVTIADADAKAEVHYTTDGKTPTVGSPIYFGPIEVQGNAKVRALAVADGEQASSVAKSTYKVKAS